MDGSGGNYIQKIYNEVYSTSIINDEIDLYKMDLYNQLKNTIASQTVLSGERVNTIAEDIVKLSQNFINSGDCFIFVDYSEKDESYDVSISSRNLNNNNVWIETNIYYDKELNNYQIKHIVVKDSQKASHYILKLYSIEK